MAEPSSLEDPETAAFAWGRYRRLMMIMAAVTIGTVAVALVVLSRMIDQPTIHFYIATGLGIAGTMMLMSALMGLVFLSNGTGHDHSVIDPLDDDRRG